MSKAAVIINFKAGTVKDLGAEDLKTQIITTFKKFGYEATIYSLTEERTQPLIDVVKEINPKVIVAVGGDGTMNSISSMLCGQNTPMGIIPLGTFNLLAKDFNIPNDIDKAIEIITKHQIVDVDMAEVNEHKFINNSFVGLYPEFVKERDKIGFKNKRQKYLAMLKAAKNLFFKFPNFAFTISSENEDLTLITPFVYISVGSSTIERSFKSRAMQEPEGLLSVAIARKRTRFRNFIIVVREFLRLGNLQKELHNQFCKKLKIESKKPELKVSFDGELKELTTPLDFKIIPKAIKLCSGPNETKKL